MPSEKELRLKIASIKSSQKITRAMEMVAASKMRKSQDRMQTSRPYAAVLRRVIGRIAAANIEYKHPYLRHRPLKKVGYLVISTDRGLCGGLNTNLFKHVLSACAVHQSTGVSSSFSLFGAKAVTFFANQGCSILAQKTGLGDAPALTDIIGPIQVMLEAFNLERIDALYLAYNRFVTTSQQEACVEQLLPLYAPMVEADRRSYAWDYLYEPDPKGLLDQLFLRICESLLYQAVVENVACEQAARMLAMQAASDNAATLLEDLERERHKLRQASITQELTEIVAGATAVGL